MSSASFPQPKFLSEKNSPSLSWKFSAFDRKSLGELDLEVEKNPLPCHLLQSDLLGLQPYFKLLQVVPWCEEWWSGIAWILTRITTACNGSGPCSMSFLGEAFNWAALQSYNPYSPHEVCFSCLQQAWSHHPPGLCGFWVPLSGSCRWVATTALLPELRH